jgi:chromate reductase, NAD(P)H dehydrogenase (quinone)
VWTLASRWRAGAPGRSRIGFMDLVEGAKHYPCAKTKWFEYLGKRPDPVIDRVE